MEKILSNIIEVKDYLSKSNLPTCDYVINPYVGCPHGCKYCYASFMKRFTRHSEEWGSFIDIKHCKKPISKKLLHHKSVFLSSVTDCYNAFEKEHKITRNILKQLIDIDCEISISTKSSLILRDLDLLKQLKHLHVSVSINTLDESFKDAMDHASSIQERLTTLQTLHAHGIHTILFMSPMFPAITDFKAIIEKSSSFVDEFWFENLNLRGGYKKTILDYIQLYYPQYLSLYDEIYRKKNKQYWIDLSIEIKTYCEEHSIPYRNFFYHEELVKKKLAKKRENKNE